MKYWDCVNDQVEEILSKHQGLRRMFRNGRVGHSHLLALSDIHLAIQSINNGWEARYSQAVRRYFEWIDCLSRSCIPAGPVLDVLENSTSFLNIDSRRRKRKGWARGAFLNALECHSLAHPQISPFNRAGISSLNSAMIPAASFLPNQYVVAHL
jgi:hypothetical protein